MPRRKISTSANKLKKGRSQGHGQDYTPFLFTREVPSMGKSTRIKGWKTGRVHHFLSTLESNYFYVLEWSPLVVDIREQYALPLEATQKIAERLSIKHPFNVKAQEPAIVTTDFLIDVTSSSGKIMLKARSTKYASDLNDLRTFEKLEIERTYWCEQGVDWGIVTELDIPKELAKNVEWLHSAFDSSEAPGITREEMPFLENELHKQMLAEPSVSIAKIGIGFDNRLGLRGGTALWLVRHLIANRQWQVDMMARIAPNKPLKAIRLAPPLLARGDGLP